LELNVSKVTKLLIVLKCFSPDRSEKLFALTTIFSQQKKATVGALFVLY